MIQQKLVSDLREFKAGFLIFLYCLGKMRFYFEIKSPNKNLKRHFFHVSSFEHLHKKKSQKYINITIMFQHSFLRFYWNLLSD